MQSYGGYTSDTAGRMIVLTEPVCVCVWPEMLNEGASNYTKCQESSEGQPGGVVVKGAGLPHGHQLHGSSPGPDSLKNTERGERR